MRCGDILAQFVFTFVCVYHILVHRAHANVAVHILIWRPADH
jgi:hypothetical protein